VDPVTRTGGWDIYRDDQFIFNGKTQPEHDNSELTLSLVAKLIEVVEPRDLELVQLLADGATYAEAAEILNPTYTGRPADWVGSRMRAVRYRLCEGNETMAGAGEWLDRLRDVSVEE
jgi:hypothetical protein